MKFKVVLVTSLFSSIVTGAIGGQLGPAGVPQHGGTRLVAGAPAAGKLDIAPVLYSFELKAGQIATLTIDKSGTDVELQLFRPDGRIVRAANCLHSGPLRISEIASTAGEYALQMRSCPGVEVPYTLTLSSVTTATRDDSAGVAAARLANEASLLITQYRADSNRSAIRKLEEAFTQWKALGDPESISTLITIAKLRRDLGDNQTALKNAELAAAIAEEMRDPALRVTALVTVGEILMQAGDAKKALEIALSTTELSRSSSNIRSRAEALHFLGAAKYGTGDLEQAADALGKAASIWRNLFDREGLARTLSYSAAIESDLSHFDRALQTGSDVLDIFRAINDRAGQAEMLTTLGNFQTRRGRRQEALNSYEQARLLLQDSGDLFQQQNLLFGIARTYLDLGDSKTALRLFEEALSKSKALKDTLGVAAALRAIGQSHFALDDPERALVDLKQGLAAAREAANKRYEAFLLRDIGLVYEALGDNTKALENLNQALDLSHSNKDRRLEASALTGIGHIHESAGEMQQALEAHEQALRLSEDSEDPLGRLTALYRIAECLKREGRFHDALMRTQSALDAIEKLRSSVANIGLRTSYFASVQRQYELTIELLMQLHRESSGDSNDVLAFQASERSRARSLLDSIAETRLSLLDDVDPALSQRELSLRSLLDSQIDRYSQLRLRNPGSKAVSDLEDEIQRLTAEYNELQGQIRDRNPRYTALVRPEPVELGQVQKELLDQNSLLLEYSLGDENSYLWAITPDSFTSYTLPKRAEIEAKVRLMRELLTARKPIPGERPGNFLARVKRAEGEYPKVAEELSKVLLGPVVDKLASQRLIIVGEGVLQYLPFAALPIPRPNQEPSYVPLVSKHEVIHLPSASTLAVIRSEAPLRAAPDRTLAVFADPVFQAQDPRVHRTAGASRRPAAPVKSAETIRSGDAVGVRLDFPRLSATQQEAEAILALVPPDKRMAALGFNATKAAAMSADLKRYRITHFATHAVLNDDHPDLSSLVLSLVDEKGLPQNGFLRLRDMYNLHLSAELVVLSACDTALGKEVRGEGLMSMVRGFMYSGTPRVLASLWEVDDEATAELMKEFYKQMLQDGRTPAAALREAQIAQMQRKSRQAPYYWAGFQLQGEWK